MTQASLFGDSRPSKGQIKKTASISPCGQYRWTLSRKWGDGKQACWLMLNPSTADATQDDPTIRRVIHFTTAWGFHGFTVVNLYPFRSSSPAECRRWADWENNGPDWYARDALQNNAAIVAREAKDAAMIVAAWGGSAWDTDWIENIIEEIADNLDIYCLGITDSGSPKHPMARGNHRIPDDQKPILWRPSST
jgi:hypothetical protein